MYDIIDNTANKRYWRSGEPDTAKQKTIINTGDLATQTQRTQRTSATGGLASLTQPDTAGDLATQTQPKQYNME